MMTKEKLTELLKIAYRWGRDNGEGRSEKNFNDLLNTNAVNEALHIHVVMPSACNFYMAGNDTSGKCNNCSKPQYLH